METNLLNRRGKIILIAILAVILAVIAIIAFISLNKPEYEITFDSNGGTLISPITVKKNEKITKPTDPKRQGYVFSAWYYNDNLYDFNSPVKSNMTLKAGWIKDVANKDEDNDLSDTPNTIPTQEDNNIENNNDNNTNVNNDNENNNSNNSSNNNNVSNNNSNNSNNNNHSNSNNNSGSSNNNNGSNDNNVNNNNGNNNSGNNSNNNSGNNNNSNNNSNGNTGNSNNNNGGGNNHNSSTTPTPEKYIVKFDYKYNNVTQEVEVQEGRTVSKPANTIIRKGYKLVSWYLNDTEYDFTKPVEKSMTLTAKWVKLVEIADEVTSVIPSMDERNDLVATIKNGDIIAIDVLDIYKKISEIENPFFENKVMELLNREEIAGVNITYVKSTANIVRVFSQENNTITYSFDKNDNRDSVHIKFKNLVKTIVGDYETATLKDLDGLTFYLDIILDTNNAELVGENKTYSIKFNSAIDVDKIVEQAANTIKDSNIYNISKKENEFTFEIKNIYRINKIFENKENNEFVKAVDSIIMNNDAIDSVEISYDNINEKLLIGKDRNSYEAIQEWLNKYVETIFNVSELDNVTNDNLSKKSFNFTIKLAQDEKTTKYKSEETYKIKFEVEDYVIVDINQLFNQYIQKVKNTNKYNVTSSSRTAILEVKNNYRETKLLNDGENNPFVAELSNILQENKNIENITIQNSGNEKVLQINSLTSNIYEEIYKWLVENVLDDNSKVEPNIQDIANNQFIITIKLTPDARTKNGNIQEAYKIEFRKQEFNVVPVKELVNENIEALKKSNKYNITLDENNIGIQVKNMYREDLAKDNALSIIMALNDMIQKNKGIETITIKCSAVEEKIVINNNDENSYQTVISWMNKYANEILNGKSFETAKNEDLAGKTFDILIKLSAGTKTTEEKDEESYSIKYTAEDYIQVHLNDLYNNRIEEVKNTDWYIVTAENKDIILQVKNIYREEKVQDSILNTFVSLANIIKYSDKIDTVKITEKQTGKTVSITSRDENITEIISAWISKDILGEKALTEAINDEIAGKTFDITTTLTKDARTEDNKKEETYNFKFTAQGYVQVYLNSLFSKRLEEIKLTNKYNVAEKDKNITLQIKNFYREEKIQDSSLNTFLSLGSLVNDSNKIDTVKITEKGTGKAVSITSKDTNIKDTIVTWLSKEVLEGKALTEIMNDNLAGKTFDVSVTLAKDARTEDNKKGETYTIIFKAEDYIAVPVSELFNKRVEEIKVVDKYTVVEDNNNLTIQIKNIYREDKLQENTLNIFVTLANIIKDNERIDTVKITEKGTGKAVSITDKEENVTEKITTWLSKDILGGKTLDEAINDNLKGKSFDISIMLTADARTENNEKGKVYTVKFTAQDYVIVNISNLVNNVIEEFKTTGKYNIMQDGNNITLEVKNIYREDSVLESGLTIFTSLTTIMNENKNIETIKVKCNGIDEELIINNDGSNSKDAIYSWITKYINVILNGKSISTAVNEDLDGKVFDISLILTKDARTEKGEKEVKYNLQFTAEGYAKVRLNDIFNETIEEIKTANKYDVTKNGNDVTLQIKNIYREDKIQDSSLNTFLSVANIINDSNKIDTVKITERGTEKSVSITSIDTNVAEKITLWLSQDVLEGKTLVEALNEELAGKTFDILINLTADARTDDNKTEETYSLKIMAQDYVKVSLNDLFDKKVEEIKQTDKYNVTENNKNVALQIKNLYREDKIQDSSLNTFLSVANIINDNDKIDTVKITEKGTEKSVSITSVTANIKEAITTWLSKEILAGEALTEAANDNLSGKTFDITIILTKDARTEDGKTQGEYSIGFTAQNYIQVSLNELFSKRVEEIKLVDQYTVSESNNNITAQIKNIYRENNIQDSTLSTFITLANVINDNEKIDTVKITEKGTEKTVSITSKDENIREIITTWLSQEVLSGKTLTEAINDNLVGKTFNIVASLTKDARTEKDEKEVGYNVTFTAQDYITVNVSNLVNNRLEEFKSAGKYNVNKENNDITLEVKNIYRKELAQENGLTIFTLLSNIVKENKNIETLMIKFSGVEETLIINNSTSNPSESIIAWINKYATVILNGKTISTAANEDLSGKTFNVTTTLTKDARTENNKKEETYNFKFTAQDYVKVSLDELFSKTIEEIRATNQYNITKNNKNATIQIKNSYREEIIQNSGLNSLVSLGNMIKSNDKVKSVKITEKGTGKSVSITSKDANIKDAVSKWLSNDVLVGKDLSTALNEELSGKSFDIDITLTDDARTEENTIKETYTVGFTVEDYIKVSIVNMFNNSLEEIKQTNKYNITNTDKKVTAQIKNMYREEKIQDSSLNTFVTLGNIAKNNNKVDSVKIVHKETGKLLSITNTATNIKDSISSWLSKEILGGKALTTAVNDELAGKTFNITVMLTKDARTTEGNKEETYSIQFTAQDYVTVPVSNLFNKAVDEIKQANKYNVTQDGKKTSIQVKNTNRTEKIQDSSLNVFVSLGNIAKGSDKIETVKLTCKQVGKTVSITNQTANVKETISTWLSKDVLGGKALTTTTNEELDGKTFDITVSLIADSRSSDGNKEETYNVELKIEPYTVTFVYDNGTTSNQTVYVGSNGLVTQPQEPTKSGHKFMGWYLADKQFNFTTKVTSNITLTAKWIKTVDLAALQDKALNTSGCVNELKDLFQVSITDKDVIVTIIKPSFSLWSLDDAKYKSKLKKTIIDFMNGPGIDYINVWVGSSPVKVTKSNASSAASDLAWELFWELDSFTLGGFTKLKPGLMKVDIYTTKDYVFVDGSTLKKYTMVFKNQ